MYTQLKNSTCSSKCPHGTSLDNNSHCKTSTRVCFVEAKQSMTTKKNPRPRSHSNDNYLTLAELKDLGLALRQESTNYSDRQSAFSMQCWPNIDVSETGKKEQRRRKRSKKGCSSPITSTMEQLCYLGPNLSRVEGSISATKTSQLPKDDLEIKHTHQHHHFHHIIHHSISQPNIKECISIVPSLALPVTKPASL